MELDFTAQLQPALWGLLIALVTATTALAVSVDRSEIDLSLMRDWPRLWRLVRVSWDRGLVRLATVARSLTNQLLLRERRKA